VSCDREDVRFWRPNRFVVRNAQQAQEHLLDDVWNVSDVADAGSQEAPQLLPMLRSKLLYQRMLGLPPQTDTLGTPVWLYEPDIGNPIPRRAKKRSRLRGR
jgi:hypothetical protein